MEKVKVEVLHYVNGRGVHISDAEPLEIDERLLNGQILPLSAVNDYCSVIYNYCKNFAKRTVPYDTNHEDYMLQFWHKGDLISSALLSNFSEFFGQKDDAEIAE